MNTDKGTGLILVPMRCGVVSFIRTTSDRFNKQLLLLLVPLNTVDEGSNSLIKIYYHNIINFIIMLQTIILLYSYVLISCPVFMQLTHLKNWDRIIKIHQ